MITDLTGFLIGPERTIRQAMALIGQNTKGIALVVDGEGRLVATITDGDIRRAILAGLPLDQPVRRLLAERPPEAGWIPTTAPTGTPAEKLIDLMTERSIRHIPLLDDEGRVAALAVMADLIKQVDPPLRAVIMAGGFGKRLMPLTEETPKPMLPVGDRPLLELTIEQLKNSGINRVNVTTHYKSRVIADHFGDGRKFGVEIEYVEESRPLGTAGALGLLEMTGEPLLVINGDILTRVDFRAMLDYHREHKADMTVGVKSYEMRVPFGVVETERERVVGLSEKPVIRHFINAGIYLVDPEVCGLVKNGQACDMTDLIERLIALGRTVVSFPISEYWLDVGRLDDYQRANEDVNGGRY